MKQCNNNNQDSPRIFLTSDNISCICLFACINKAKLIIFEDFIFLFKILFLIFDNHHSLIYKNYDISR